jgi:hypothetical protein
MTRMTRTIFLSVCLTVISTAQFVAAQTDSNPLATIKYDRQSKIIGIFWSDKKPDLSCFKSYANLRLVKILYDNDEDAYQLGNLIFTNTKGIREEFMFLLNPLDYSTVVSSNLRVFIGEGNSYRVGAFRCGAGGNSDPQIFSIETIPVKKIVIKQIRNNVNT